ncbi:alpha/beta fold hydrolase [uncultured Jannaschia sp.]|uniref:alpha/beta hydrolase family protein n=1 Tax=uncultured Jannaschia sp. TaxID=293347 RepID=UPI00261F7D33|nr:alpha/beta fold hydrolase [uncultured Jannaschia sp.]
MSVETKSIPSGDRWLAGRLARPDTTPRAVAVLHGATGVPARFYAEFADWLAATRGLACLTYDYRDFGASSSARGSDATMTDWGVRDQQAARDCLRAALPDAPLWVIGHSLGGMMLPFQTGLDGIERVFTVASGAVHVSDHPWPYQALARAFWSPVLPPLARRLGYLPARAMRVGHDLPAEVYAQWRIWCTSRGFHAADATLGRPNPHALTCGVRMVAVADDDLCPPQAVWRLMRAYPQARKRQVTIVPGAVGLERIGHLDILGPRGRPAWDSVMGPAD